MSRPTARWRPGPDKTAPCSGPGDRGKQDVSRIVTFAADIDLDRVASFIASNRRSRSPATANWTIRSSYAKLQRVLTRKGANHKKFVQSASGPH